MPAGRPAKPVALKLLQGNPGKRALPKNTPKPAQTAPKMPSWLAKEAKAEWKRIVPELDRLGLLTQVDRSALAGYCQSWARYVEAELALTTCGATFETDKGYVGQRPEVAMSQKYLQLMRAFCADFGLTPSARGRMTIPGKQEELDPDEQLLRELSL